MNKVAAKVDGMISLRADEVPVKVVEKLRFDLSVANPEYIRRVRMKKWIGPELEERIDVVREVDGHIVLPRGAVGALRRRLRESELDLAVNDNRTTGYEIPVLRTPSLRPYQETAKTNAINALQALTVIPTGGGKTRVGCAIIGELRRSALILVDSEDLLDQWEADVVEHLGIIPGTISDGRVDVRDVTIAIVDTLIKRPELYADGVLDRFGIVLVDEAHTAAAVTYQVILGWVAARWRIGLTATPDRTDGLTRIMELAFGEKPSFEISYRELIELRYLVPPEVKPIATRFRYPYEGPKDYVPMMDALIDDEDRNGLIVDYVGRECQAGAPSLVLSSRKPHIRTLGKLLVAAGVDARVVHGDTNKATRRDLIKRFRAGEIRCLVASTIADQGLDVPRLEATFLTYPQVAEGRTKQRVGREMRLYPTKNATDRRPRLYDFVDEHVQKLRESWNTRKKVYRAIVGEKELP